MGENRTDYQHRRRRPVHPQYEQEQRRGNRTERLREQRYAEEEMRMQQEQRRRVGARMQRNHQKQMEMRRRRKRRGNHSLCTVGGDPCGGFWGSQTVRIFEALGRQSREIRFCGICGCVYGSKRPTAEYCSAGNRWGRFPNGVNIVASLNLTTKEVHLISVPRDTRVVMTDDMIAYLEKNGRTVPQANGVYGQCKLTEVHAYAGEGNRSTFSVAILEEILGIDIDYYVKVDLDAFKDIVDAVGGVEFDVQERLYYSDPAQGLYIDLYPGPQLLDGEKAEMLVRFREGYAQKDLKRIEVQQEFLKAFISQVCSSDKIMSNLDSYIKIFMEKVESDMPVATALKYAGYIKEIDPASITTDTIPGEGGAYFDMDEEGTKELVDYRIYGKEPPAYMTDDGTETDGLTDEETTNQTNG